MKKSVMAGVAAAAVISAGSMLVLMQKDAVRATESNGAETLQTEGITEASSEKAAGQAVGNPADITAVPGSKIAVVSKCVKGEFISLVEKGMEQAVSDVNAAKGFSGSDKISFTMEGPKDELDIETQINTLDAVISENPDVLCMSIGDRMSCLAQLETAKENGIPVVVFDSGSEFMDLVSGYRASDNLKIGEIGAEKLCEAIHGTGTVAVIAGQEKTSTTADRVAGFSEKLKEYPDVQVVAVLYEDQVDDIGTAIKELLDNNPGLTGVFCTRAEEADLYLSIDKRGTAPVMVGVDGTKAQQKAIRNGTEYGCVSQDAWQIGYNSMMLAVSLTDPDAETEILTELLEPGWLDSTNIDLEVNRKFLF